MAASDDQIYKEEGLPYECYRIFKDMRQKKEFCDVTLNVGNGSIYAHKVILSACIPYFRSLFGNNVHEDQKKEISLTDISLEALEALIDFAYTCELRITTENVQRLLITASFLQVEHVKIACVKYIMKQITSMDAISLRDLGIRSDCPELVGEIDDFIKGNFDDVSQCQEILNVPYLYLKELISSDDLHVSGEEKVFEGVIRWVKAKPDERCTELPGLLSCIRIPFLKLYYLRDVIGTDELIKGSLQCRDILDDARDYHLFPEKRHDAKHSWKFECMPRRYKKDGEDESSAFVIVSGRSPLSNAIAKEPDDKEKNLPVGFLNSTSTSFQEKPHFGFTNINPHGRVVVKPRKMSNFSMLRDRQRTHSFGWPKVPVCEFSTSEEMTVVPSAKISTSSDKMNIFFSSKKK